VHRSPGLHPRCEPRQVTAQTRHRVAGIIPDGATRRVSLHERDARPIAKGRLGKPVQFGYKAQIVDNDNDGVVRQCADEPLNPQPHRSVATGPCWAPCTSAVPARCWA